MRNIKFDESLVLREYARIAGESGMVKQAENMIKLLTPDTGTPSAEADRILANVFQVDLNSPPPPKVRSWLPQATQRFNQYIVKTVVPDIQAQTGRQAKNARAKYYIDAVNQVQAKLINWYGANNLPLVTVRDLFTFPATKAIRSVASDENTVNVKNAEQTFLQKAIQAVKNPALKQELQKLNQSITPAQLKEYLALRGFKQIPQELVPLLTAKPATAPAQAGSFLQRAIQTVKNPALKQELQKLAPNITPAQLGEYLKLRGFKQVPAELAPLLTSAASRPSLSKRAKGSDQVYDVSGETGEQLVEKAHPGGGTRTELTHSKTDENLVETIVEQQDRDIEVAKSKPKGTYAMLEDLYDQLNKMGYEKHLGTLIDAMAKLKIAEL